MLDSFIPSPHAQVLPQHPPPRSYRLEDEGLERDPRLEMNENTEHRWQHFGGDRFGPLSPGPVHKLLRHAPGGLGSAASGISGPRVSVLLEKAPV